MEQSPRHNVQLAANCTSDEEDSSPMAPHCTDPTVAWAALCDSRDVPADVDLNDYIAVDAKVIAHEDISDETIIENVRHSDGSCDDCEVQDLRVPPPAVKVMVVFDVIRSFIGAHNDDIAM